MMAWSRFARSAWNRWGLLFVVALLLLMPLAGSCWWLGVNDRFSPLGEIAITEIRVRDVGTSSTPLVGLTGRLGRTEAAAQPGSHPGPLSFYALAPAYRLFGGSYFALRASTLLLHALAIVVSLWIAQRRAGAVGVLAAGFALSALELGFGLITLSEPWNPYLPPLWFAVFLLCMWSVACEDVRLLPLAATAGCFCAQTHIAYLAVCGGLGLLALGLTGVWMWRMWRRELSLREPARACVLAASLTTLFWIPPLVDQSIHEPGNLAILADYFLHPPQPSVGFRAALRLLLTELDAWHVTVNQFREPGTLRLWLQRLMPSPERGGIVGVLWLASLVPAAKSRNRTLWALHGTVAASLLVAWLAMSRIMGVPWAYLVLWGWCVGMLTSIAIVASVGLFVWSRVDGRWRARASQLAVVGVAVIGAFSVRLLVETTNAGASAPNAALQLRALAKQTAARLSERAKAGEMGPYVLGWSDVLGGVQGFGLLDELDRRGVDVRVGAEWSAILPERCLIDPSAATARLYLASGDWIGDLQNVPGSTEIAYSDPRTAQEREEFARLYADVVKVFRMQRRDDLIANINRNLLVVHAQANDPWTGLTLGRMNNIGQPAAVFVLPMRTR